MTNEQAPSGGVLETVGSDAELHSIGWTSGGRDVELRLRLASGAAGGRRDCVLRCGWVSAFSANIRVPQNTGGYLLTWDARFERLEGSGWQVEFDFAHAGKLSFVCTAIELVTN